MLLFYANYDNFYVYHLTGGHKSKVKTKTKTVLANQKSPVAFKLGISTQKNVFLYILKYSSDCFKLKRQKFLNLSSEVVIE